MPDNTQQLGQVFQTLCAQPRADGGGQIFVVASHRSKAGTSYVARNLALCAATRKTAQKRVLLLDGDIQNNAQSKNLFAPEACSVYGQPTGPYDGTFGQIPFWMVTPARVDAYGQSTNDAQFVSLHILPKNDLAFTHFHWQHLHPNQSVMIRHVRQYWHTLRALFSYVIVDIPAFDRAQYFDEICAEADATVLISGSGETRSADLVNVYNQLKAHGCQCAGLIVNDVPISPPHYGGVA